MKGTVFLVNPAAGSGRAGATWEALVQAHPELRAAAVIRQAAAARAREELTAGLTDGARAVVVVGGDGTVQLAANVLLELGAGERVPLGLVPAGTGSDLARGLGLPSDPGAALQLALEGTPKPLDALAVRVAGAAARFVVNTASAGVSGRVVESVNALRRRRGSAYLLATLRAVLRYRPVPCRVAADGAPFFAGAVFLLAVANGSHFGKGMHIAPLARTDDGLADLVLVGALPRWQVPLRLPRLYLGKHLGGSRVQFRQVRRVTCEPLEPLPPLELDGEAVASGELEVEVLPAALRVLRD